MTDLTNEDKAIIAKIVERTKSEIPLAVPLGVEMDIEAAHKATPLRLNDFLNAESAFFISEVNGIRRNISRTKGTFSNCYLPRIAKPQ